MRLILSLCHRLLLESTDIFLICLEGKKEKRRKKRKENSYLHPKKSDTSQKVNSRLEVLQSFGTAGREVILKTQTELIKKYNLYNVIYNIMSK